MGLAGALTCTAAPADLQGLLDFLAPRVANGTMVRTTQEVIGGPFQPPAPA